VDKADDLITHVSRFTCIDAGKEVGLDVNTEKTKYTYMLLSRHQNAG
jgi:hypothetical protein